MIVQRGRLLQRPVTISQVAPGVPACNFSNVSTLENVSIQDKHSILQFSITGLTTFRSYM